LYFCFCITEKLCIVHLGKLLSLSYDILVTFWISRSPIQSFQ